MGFDRPGHDVAGALAGTISLPPPGGTNVVLTLGTNLFEGPERAPCDTVDHLSVFALASGGAQPLPYLGGGGLSWVTTRVQVTVRSDIDDFERGQSLARALHGRLHAQSLTGYAYVLALEGDPVYLGFQSSSFHRWAMNFELGRDR